MTATDPTAKHDRSLREHVLFLLRGGGAHMSLDDFVDDFPPELCGRKTKGIPYTPWQVLEHMRIAQRDILEFSRNKNHVSPKFPSGYWPAANDLGSEKQWHKTIETFRADLKQMEKLVSDPATDLLAKIPHGDGQTVFREALLIADHNAYHLGALVVLQRMLRERRSGTED
jgi:hypothetical protein